MLLYPQVIQAGAKLNAKLLKAVMLFCLRDEIVTSSTVIGNKTVLVLSKWVGNGGVTMFELI